MNECFQVAHSRFEGRRRRKLGHHTFSCGIEERRDDQMTQHEGPGRNGWRSGLGGKMKTYWSDRREHSCLDSKTWWGRFCTQSSVLSGASEETSDEELSSQISWLRSQGEQHTSSGKRQHGLLILLGCFKVVNKSSHHSLRPCFIASHLTE